MEAGLHRYAMTGRGDLKSLQGRDCRRLRLGGYRVIFDEDATTILAIYIGRRTTTSYKTRDETQRHLTFKAGIGQGYLSDLENGRRAGPPKTLAKLA
jgi:mRNA interferase RelE/StbE